jgi:hypothetical protein
VNDRNIQAFFEQALVGALSQLQTSDIDALCDILSYLMKEAPYLEEGHFKATIHKKTSCDLQFLSYYE